MCKHVYICVCIYIYIYIYPNNSNIMYQIICNCYYILRPISVLRFWISEGLTQAESVS